MKNYYEILEINQNASQEIVEKAYKVLVKKYHPDLQETPEDKKECEDKIKQINEAYDVISNIELRKEYDDKLQEEFNIKKQQQEEKIRKQYQNIHIQKEQNENQTQQIFEQKKQEYEQQRRQFVKNSMEQERQYKEAINKAYHDAYIQDLKNRGYKIKYKKTFNDYLRSLLALLLTIGVIFFVIQIPFVKEYFLNLYNNNSAIKFLVDFIMGLFK